MDFPDEHNTFQSLLLGTQRGTVGEMLCTEQLFDRSNLVSGDPSDKQSEMVVLLPHINRIALDEDDTSELIEMYKTLLPDCEIVSAQTLCDSFSRFESMATYIDVSATAVFRPSGLMESTEQEESRDS